MARKKPPPPRKRTKHKDRSPRGGVPSVSVLQITDTTEDGELLAQPVKWDEKKTPPFIIVTSGKAAKEKDRVLANLKRIKPHAYEAHVIRILPNEQPQEILGVFVATAEGGIIEPLSRKQKHSYLVHAKYTAGAKHGEMVRAVSSGSGASLKMQTAKIEERLGTLDSPRAASMIATHMHELPTRFSPAALEEAQRAEDPVMQSGREDLRDYPLVTIDGEDARDFDDAVYAKAEKDGFHIIVAIADVAHYVKQDDSLDADAYERGNSVYFPDRVIPMLPENLSNGLCSLKPGEDRYCLAVHIWIDKQGKTKRYKFVRGLMHSHHRFTYEEFQEAQDTQKHKLMDSVVKPLRGAYRALSTERDERGPLGLNLPEYKIQFGDKGDVAAIIPKLQLDSHRLIESFMITANVAAADFLLKKKRPGLYRVHEHPDEEKFEELRNFVKISGYSLPKGAITAKILNRILKKSEGSENRFMVHNAVLRAQMQAYYSHECLGHFGLSLKKYGHFTSPIRRYADLIVHRSIISILEGQPAINAPLAQTAEHISNTERKAMQAERDASDRYKISYMQNHIGDQFEGMIAGLNEYGLYVALDETGINGFIPVRHLPNDFYQYDKKRACFTGRRSKRTFHIGQTVTITVQEANALTGSLIFGILTDEHPAPKKTRKKSPKKRTKRGKKTKR